MTTPIQYGQYAIPTADVMVNFGVGQPAPGMLPLEKIRTAAAAKFAEQDPLYLQYGYISGYPQFRKVLAGFLQDRYGKEVDPELLFATNGVTGALGLICSLFATRGDTIIVENPSYFLALSIFKDFGMNIVPMEMDENGMRTDLLEEWLTLHPHKKPKFVYTIPVYHNPTGYSLSRERKIHLTKLAAKYNFTVLADEVYQLLSFPDAQKPEDPLCYFDTPEFTGSSTGNVISIGSFSKILAPALRCGWLQVSPSAKHLLDKVYGCGLLDSSGGINPVVYGIVEKAITEGLQQVHLEDTRATLSTRSNTLVDALKKFLPADAKYHVPNGGYFIWIELPEGFQGAEFLDFCVQSHKIRFHPGSKFGTNMERFIRLSFSYYDAGDIAIGVERLGAAIEAFRPLAATKIEKVLPNPTETTKVRVAVHGASGRLGSLIVAELEGAAHKQAEFVGNITRNTTDIPDCDVIIDVTSAAGTEALVDRLLQLPATASVPSLVVGTTGQLPEEKLKALAQRTRVVLAANFSVGVPLLLQLVKTAAAQIPSDWHGELTEEHHTLKLDSPSGTAKRILLALQEGGVKSFDGKDVPVHAIRLGDTFGVHTVYLAGKGERVEIKHTATRREVFAVGAIRMAIETKGQPKGYVVV